MGAEIHRLLGDLLEQLPNHHADRRFLEGLHETLAGCLDQTTVVDDPKRAEAAPQAGLPAPMHDIPIERRDSAIERTAQTPSTAEAAPSDVRSAPEQERVSLIGRLARDPVYKPIGKKQRPRISFPLGERHDDGTTTWDRCYALDRYVERIAAKGFKQGDLVQVTGTRQLRQERQADGTVKPVPYVFAYRVQHRTGAPPTPSEPPSP